MCRVSLILSLLNLALLCLVARRLERSRRSTTRLGEQAARAAESASRTVDRLASDLLDAAPRYRPPPGRPPGRASDD